MLLVAVGLLGLWLSSELVISGARNIANYFRLSPLFVGLTIVALGTDLPELFVNIRAGMDRIGGTDTSGLAIGNVIGSSIAQAVLILGLIIILSKRIKIPQRIANRDASMLVAASGLVLLLSIDKFLSIADGLILIVVYGIYMFSILREEKIKNGTQGYNLNLWWAAISILTGFYALAYSADLTLSHSLVLAKQFKIDQTVIGIAIIGLGTSLPELATSIVALKNKSSDLAIGNVLGSTVFDLLLALGVGASFAGFNISSDLIFDLAVLLTGMAFVFGLLKFNRKITTSDGYLLVAYFILYLILTLKPY